MIIKILIALLLTQASAQASLKASWYSIDSLRKEGTYRYSHGVMANGKRFDDNKYTCATRLYPLGAWIIVKNITNGHSVRVQVTDRISKRLAKKRIDLSKIAFQSIASLDQGLINIKVYPAL